RRNTGVQFLRKRIVKLPKGIDSGRLRSYIPDQASRSRAQMWRVSMRTNTTAMLLVGVALSVALSIGARRPIAATPCTNLISTALAHGTVPAALDVTGPFTTTASSGAATITVAVPFAFCRVTARLTPTADSSITMELWMPEPAHWNGKFLGVGNGALTGAIW